MRLGKQFRRIVEGVVEDLMARPSSEKICEFVAGDGKNPRRQGLIRLIRMATVMHGQQHLLQQILDFTGLALQPGAQKAAYMTT
ncbi:hypothetical protein D3C73_1444680 [compost metagenome]